MRGPRKGTVRKIAVSCAEALGHDTAATEKALRARGANPLATLCSIVQMENDDGKVIAIIRDRKLTLHAKWHLYSMSDTVAVVPVSFAFDDTLREPFKGLVQRFLSMMLRHWPSCNRTPYYEWAVEMASEAMASQDRDQYEEEYLYNCRMITEEDACDTVYESLIQQQRPPLTREELEAYIPARDERALHDAMLEGIGHVTDVPDPFAYGECFDDGGDTFEQLTPEYDQVIFLQDHIFYAPSPVCAPWIVDMCNDTCNYYSYSESFVFSDELRTRGTSMDARSLRGVVEDYFDWVDRFIDTLCSTYYNKEENDEREKE